MNRQPAQMAPCQALARTLGWITSVATMVVLGFIANRWPEKLSSIVGGIVGVSSAAVSYALFLNCFIFLHFLSWLQCE